MAEQDLTLGEAIDLAQGYYNRTTKPFEKLLAVLRACQVAEQRTEKLLRQIQGREQQIAELQGTIATLVAQVPTHETRAKQAQIEAETIETEVAAMHAEGRRETARLETEQTRRIKDAEDAFTAQQTEYMRVLRELEFQIATAERKFAEFQAVAGKR